MKYTGIIREGEDFGYVAECPALAGCISQGETYDETINNIKEAIEVYMEALKEDNIQLSVKMG